jgi:hypothetical protein
MLRSHCFSLSLVDALTEQPQEVRRGGPLASTTAMRTDRVVPSRRCTCRRRRWTRTSACLRQCTMTASLPPEAWGNREPHEGKTSQSLLQVRPRCATQRSSRRAWRERFGPSASSKRQLGGGSQRRDVVRCVAHPASSSQDARAGRDDRLTWPSGGSSVVRVERRVVCISHDTGAGGGRRGRRAVGRGRARLCLRRQRDRGAGCGKSGRRPRRRRGRGTAAVFDHARPRRDRAGRGRNMDDERGHPDNLCGMHAKALLPLQPQLLTEAGPPLLRTRRAYP